MQISVYKSLTLVLDTNALVPIRFIAVNIYAQPVQVPQSLTLLTHAGSQMHTPTISNTNPVCSIFNGVRNSKALKMIAIKGAYHRQAHQKVFLGRRPDG